MRRCDCCGYDPARETPIFDEHARRIADYLDETGERATLAVLSRELGIPNGSLYNRWFRLKANRAGVHFARHGRTTYASREVNP